MTDKTSNKLTSMVLYANLLLPGSPLTLCLCANRRRRQGGEELAHTEKHPEPFENPVFWRATYLPLQHKFSTPFLIHLISWLIKYIVLCQVSYNRGWSKNLQAGSCPGTGLENYRSNFMKKNKSEKTYCMITSTSKFFST